MTRQFGSSAFFLIILSAFASRVTGPGNAPSVPRSTNTTAAKSDTATASAAQPTPPAPIDADAARCPVFEILRRHSAHAEASPNSPAPAPETTCSAQPSRYGLRPEDFSPSQILIATVPDPLQSANTLEFDRDIESLQEAAATLGYDFESILIPWYLSDLEEPKDMKGGREAQHYRRLFGDQPGAMLFHRSSRGNPNEPIQTEPLLLIVLVPESPTYGVNRHAAKEALTGIDALTKLNFSTGPEKGLRLLRWIGPNYSSSAESLQPILQLEAGEGRNWQFDIFSGTITSKAAATLLQKVQSKKSSTHDRLPAFQTASALDFDSLRVLRHSGVLPSEGGRPIALLQEDESAYGSSSEIDPAQKDHELRVFRFPRGVSHVRGVFGSQFLSFQALSTKDSDPQKITFDFADALQQPLDTSPEFSLQSPFSDEGVLATISAAITHMHASAIVILATDPLDQLFLARYFHDKAPNARLVLFSAERLIPRLRGEFNLDGTLVVTRFPLFDDSFLQTPLNAQFRHSLTSMSSTQEAVFLAALTQISKADTGAGLTTDDVSRAGIWTAISSGGSFWPVQHSESVLALPKSDGYALVDTPQEPLPTLWSVSLSIVLLCSALHLFFFLVAAHRYEPEHECGGKNESRGLISHFKRHRFVTFYLHYTPPATSDTARAKREFGRYVWLLNASLQLLLILTFLLLPAIFYAGGLTQQDFLCRVGTFVSATSLYFWSALGPAGLVMWLAILVLCLYLTANLLLTQFPSLHLGLRETAISIAMPLISWIWAVANLIALWHQLGRADAGWLFSLRSVHLTSGVCPVLPLLLVSLGFIVAAIVNLNALSIATDRNPGFPNLKYEPLLEPSKSDDHQEPAAFQELQSRVDRFQKQIQDLTESWGVLPDPYGPVLLLFVAIACLALHPPRLFESIDGRGMQFLYAFTFIFAFWTIAWLWLRFLCIWKLLRFILECLEGSPLRFAFSRLPRIFSLAPIWSYAGLRRTIILPMRWLEYLKITPSIATDRKHNDCVMTEEDLLKKTVACLGEDQAITNNAYVAFSKNQNDYATALAQIPMIKRSWERGGPDASLDGTAKASAGDSGTKDTSTPAAGCRDDVPNPCAKDSPESCKIAVVNEFLAMRFGAYIRYVNLQLKNLMTFMSLGLLLFMLATVSYSFNQPQNIAIALVLIVGIMLVGLGTALAQMDRDSILSRMSETIPGKLDRTAFIQHMLSVGGLPLLTALSALFPSIGNFLFAWVRPLLNTVH